MKLTKISTGVLVLIMEMFFLGGCKTDNFDDAQSLGREPVLEPDYSGVTIPQNIAPMNFIILEDVGFFKIRATSPNGTRLTVKSSDRIVRFPVKSWKRLLEGSQGRKIEIEVISEDKGKIGKKYNPISINVASEPVDPYLCYRLLYPGYKFWGEMKIVQRSTEDFIETSLFENQLLEDNCVNCHSFKQSNTGLLLILIAGTNPYLKKQ
jgi:hypothetical protein